MIILVYLYPKKNQLYDSKATGCKVDGTSIVQRLGGNWEEIKKSIKFPKKNGYTSQKS